MNESAGRVSNKDRSSLIACFAVPYLCVYWYCLNHFYYWGGYSWDSGWIAYLIGHPSVGLPNPPILDLEFFGSYYGYHFTPALTLLSWISALLPVSPPRLFSIFSGLVYGSLGAAIYAALRLHNGRISGPLAAAAAIASALNGASLAAIGFPHFEPAIPAFILGFLTLRALGLNGPANCAFALCLLAREDGGLHMISVLMPVAAYRLWRTRSAASIRGELIYGAAALAYVLVAMAIQEHWTAGGHAFRRVYVGTPPFANVTWALLLQRVQFFLDNRAYLYLPCLVSVAGALLLRNLLILAGFAAALPWLVLNLLAIDEPPGQLIAYYDFPFILAVCWPAVTVALGAGWGRALAARPGAYLQLAVAGASIAGFLMGGALQDPSPWHGFRPLPQRISTERTDRLVRWIGETKPALGRVIAGDGVVALAPDRFDWAEWYQWNDTWSDARFAEADTLVYFRSERLRVARLPFTERYPDAVFLEAPGTDIVMLTRKPYADLTSSPGLLSRPCMRLPARLSFADPFPEPALLEKGWSGPEKEGRWSDAPTADLSIQLCQAPESDLDLVLDAHGLVFDRRPRSEMEIFVNGAPVGTVAFRQGTPDAPVTVRLARRAFGDKDDLRLTFRFDDPRSPSELGLSDDRRALGIFMRSLTLEAAR